MLRSVAMPVRKAASGWSRKRVIPSVARDRCGRAAPKCRSSHHPPTPVPRYARDDSLAVILAIFIAGCSTTSQQKFDQPIADSRAQIEQLVRQAAIPSAAIAVAVDDRIVWLDSFGAPV